MSLNFAHLLDCRVSCPWGNAVATFDLTSFILVGNNDMHMSLNFVLIQPLTMELAALEDLKLYLITFVWHNILCLNLGLDPAVSSLESLAFEHCKIFMQSLPTGLLVVKSK